MKQSLNQSYIIVLMFQYPASELVRLLGFESEEHVIAFSAQSFGDDRRVRLAIQVDHPPVEPRIFAFGDARQTKQRHRCRIDRKRGLCR